MKSLNQLGKSASIISIVFSVLMVTTYQSTAAPLTPGNVLISDPFHLGQSVIEYQSDGTLVQTIPVEQPTYAGDVGGITFDEKGLLWLYNGNVSPYLSSWDSESNTWTHDTYPDWNSFLCFPCQGIGTFDNFVFASDWGSFGNPNGIVRFNRDDVTWVRFSEGNNYSALAVGLDGLLYARRADGVSPPPPTMIDIFDPVTLELLNTVTLSDRSLTIAADASGQLYGASYQSILHYGTDGILIDTHPVISEGYLYTLALSSDGRFVVVSSDGEVVIVGADFIPLHSFRIITGSWAYAAIIPEPTTGIEIDIKPNNEDNSINPRSTGSLSVAILTTENFDALQVDPMTVQFGPAGAVDSHGRTHVKDIDDDGDIDLLFHFRTPETGIQCGDTEAVLMGETWDGASIRGADSVNTVGCEADKLTYTYRGNSFEEVDGLIFTTNDRVTAQFTIDCAAAHSAGNCANLPYDNYLQHGAVELEPLSFSAGPAGLPTSDGEVEIAQFSFSTDSTGRIVDWDMDLFLFDPSGVINVDTDNRIGGPIDSAAALGGIAVVRDNPGEWRVEKAIRHKVMDKNKR